MKNPRKIVGALALLVAAAAIAGLPVSEPYNDDDELNAIAIQNSGYTNQFRVGQIVEFCFTNGICAKFSKNHATMSIQWTRVSAPYSQETNNATPICNKIPTFLNCVNGTWERLPTWSWIGSGPLTNFDSDWRYLNSSTWHNLATGSGLTQCVPVVPPLNIGMEVRVRTITPAGNSAWCKIPIAGAPCDPNNDPP